MTSDARVGPYRILRLINRGGQGQVFLGYDKRLQRRVAIKIYPLPSGRRARHRLLREARQVAAIQSQKVVQVYDVVQSSEHLALVLEYCPGCDLEELLANTQLSLASCLRIAADIAGGLAAARQQRIVHGDLKAANVLITSTGRAKLTDFGIAHHDKDEQLAGSPSALSPEQVLGQGGDLCSDLFALGRLLYRMVAGRDPFAGDARIDIERLRSASYTPLAEALPAGQELPEPLLQLVARLLQADPADRPANTHQVRRLLRRAMHSLPLSGDDNLLCEARPFFRPESAEDLPPPIPAGMGRQARSRLRLRPRIPVRGPWAVPLVLCSLAVLVAGLALFKARPIPLVQVDATHMQLELGQVLPGDVSGSWLAAELAAAIVQSAGRVQLTGAVPRREYHAGRDDSNAPDERLRPSLRCGSQFCVFALERVRPGGSTHRQALLFPDASESRWRQVIRDTAAALYE